LPGKEHAVRFRSEVLALRAAKQPGAKLIGRLTSVIGGGASGALMTRGGFAGEGGTFEVAASAPDGMPTMSAKLATAVAIDTAPVVLDSIMEIPFRQVSLQQAAQHS
jgi:hypothetical protein